MGAHKAGRTEQNRILQSGEHKNNIDSIMLRDDYDRYLNPNRRIYI